MRYRYEDLGDVEFQQLVQALLAHALGPKMRAMPLRKADGGRDALYDSSVYQVKFTISPDKISDPVKWLLSTLDNEAEKVIALVDRGARDYYLVTNVEGTGNLDSGTIDRLDRELKIREQAWSIAITPWWRETIDAQVSAAPNALVRPFMRILPPDQVLAITKLDMSDGASRRDRVLAAYLRDQYDADDQVKFGEVDLLGPSVHKLFVDVRVASREKGSEPYRLMAQMGGVDATDVDTADAPASRQWEAGGAQLLLHPTWRGNAMIIGGPGQGKTTLLQYVCQAYRSLHLDLADYVSTRGYRPHVARIPFRVDLRAYAEWLALFPKRRKKNDRASEALEEYLAGHVAQNSGSQTFTTDDLAAVLAATPALLALDGLDEVADLALRERVARQIAKTARRLDSPDIDIVILVTTRPGATDTQLKLGDGFPELIMQRLTKHLQLGYLKRWAQQNRLDDTGAGELRDRFISNLELPHVAELASSPMQMAILLHLLQRRGILPEQRTQLYADYVQIFFDREAPKEPIVRDHRRLLMALHRYLAWHLQARAELGNTSGKLQINDMKQLIGQFLRDYDDNSPDLMALFTSVTARVVCIVQRHSGAFEFEVQPLREYFAACHLEEGAQSRGRATKDARLAELLKRPYWSNVLRFFVGLLSDGEVKSVPIVAREVRADSPLDALPLTRTVLVQLLRDQVYQGMTAVAVRGAVEAVLEGPGCILAMDGLLDDSRQPLALSTTTGGTQVASYTRERLKTEPDPFHRAALADLLLGHDDPNRVREWCWSDDFRQPTMTWLRTAARLRALSNLSSPEAEHVLRCCRTGSGAQRDPLLPLLLEAGSNIQHGELARACIVDFSDGHGHGLAGADGTLLGDLHAYAHPDRFYAHRLAARLGATGGEIRRRRRRGTQTLDAQSLTTGLKAAHQAGEWASNEPWAYLLEIIATGFGDSWLLREALIIVPDDLSPTESGSPRLTPGAEPAALAAWLRLARHHNDDESWWLEQASRLDGGLAARTWVVTLVLFAKAAVLLACIPTLNRVLRGLTGHEAATTVATVYRYAKHLAPRRLDLHGPLRSRAAAPSPLAALLLFRIAYDTTQPELARIVTEQVAELLSLHSDVTEPALQIVGDYQRRALRPTMFDGTRSQIDPGMLRGIDVANVSVAAATRILSQPGRWPAELVATANLALAAELSKQPPLATVARDQRWFSD
ncbi:hypothetical protein V6U90_32680 [Micromonospora sp. CPCC 206060]|uniref:NACHT domain-containing protein n=1 Tax=Micromonospora sp. CPCC 206060 TaxID=3122406 RepID=UPI002FEF694B